MEKTSRREFLKSSALTGGGLVIAFHLPQFAPRVLAQSTKLAPPDAFLRISPENEITVTVNKLEMGQGVFTSMAQLIAEELDCDWKKVRSVSAPVDPVYNSTRMPFQLTGGSSSLSSSYEQYRRVGATARAQLVQAAALKWSVSPDTCRTEDGFVVHDVKGKVSYGELSQSAAKLSAPKSVRLKEPKQFKIIGKSVARVDALEKSNGQAIFGLDVRIPGMQYAMLLRPPVFGATIAKVDANAAKAVAGVSGVFTVGQSVAVVANNTWNARRGRDRLSVEWNMNGKDKISNESLRKDFKKLAETPSYEVIASPEAIAELKTAKNLISAEYEFPYLAHAPMEPLNCTINYDGRSAEIWSGHQSPTLDRDTAAKILGLASEKIKVNTVYAGGSFGRRASKNSDYVVEACELAKQLRKPVQVVWTREDDIKGGFYRPMCLHTVRISTKNGKPEAWHHTIVGQSLFAGSPFEKMIDPKKGDATLTEGVADTPYKIPKFQLNLEMPKLEIPTLWWRSVGHTHTAYVMETLIDELAERSKTDALTFRMSLLKADEKRHQQVLELLAKKSPWGKKPKKGRAYGLAVHESFNSVVGQVVEVSMNGNLPRVHQVWSAVHCGRVINPEGAKTQVEGAIVYGLSAALYGEIKIVEGKIINGNFNDYPVLRMGEMPKVDVFFVEGGDAPTGLGEPGLPPIAPAVANAVYKLTGKRVRRLPFVV